MRVMIGFLKASCMQSPIAFGAVFSFGCSAMACVLLLSGCASTKPDVSTRDTVKTDGSRKERMTPSKQDAALRDPFNYGPKVSAAIEADKKTKTINKSDGLKRDLERVFNP